MNEKMKILFSAPTQFLDLIKLQKSSPFEINFHEIRTQKEIFELRNKEEFYGWVVNPCPEFIIDESILDLFQNMRVITTPSTGKSHIELSATTKRDIVVRGLLESNVVSSITASSEFTFMLCLNAVRKARSSFRAVIDGHWRDMEHELRGREIRELTVGIIGFGRIGCNLKKYFDSMGSKVVVFDTDPSKTKELDRKNCGTVDQILAQSDIVITPVTLSETNERMANAQFFSKMKQGSIFINTSRGDVVDEVALLRALESGKLSACALDVLSSENKPDFLNDNPLVKYSQNNDNLILTPHMAGLTFDSEIKAQTAALKLLLEVM